MIPTESPIRTPPPARSGHVCPAWAGPLLCCPLRRLLGSPEKLLSPHVSPGMAVLEPGPGMGWFTLPLARLVSPAGRVVARDLQPAMVAGLRRRAKKAGLLSRIDAAACAADDLSLVEWQGRIDAAFLIHVLHEVPDHRRLLTQVHAALRAGGRLLLLEPKGHVSAESLAGEVAEAARVGFRVVSEVAERRSHGALLEKPGA
ncbi:MAG TPA: class I SAM-dependent methyltransferase [Thermoanaerobaculia bacterium]|nr:class I SAM-dependent methyltransferase [Thermoanaerobaculia bacterium]HQN06016.1 class I SAM-dependent methyltransferase [Thermoanaerobaculia bacterium]HQP85035.1 class I SAM-dependent methyltransferase [Thermoanaerobaculia bacterium]